MLRGLVSALLRRLTKALGCRRLRFLLPANRLQEQVQPWIRLHQFPRRILNRCVWAWACGRGTARGQRRACSPSPTTRRASSRRWRTSTCAAPAEKPRSDTRDSRHMTTQRHRSPLHAVTAPPCRGPQGVRWRAAAERTVGRPPRLVTLAPPGWVAGNIALAPLCSRTHRSVNSIC